MLFEVSIVILISTVKITGIGQFNEYGVQANILASISLQLCHEGRFYTWTNVLSADGGHLLASRVWPGSIPEETMTFCQDGMHMLQQRERWSERKTGNAFKEQECKSLRRYRTCACSNVGIILRTECGFNHTDVVLTSTRVSTTSSLR